MWQDKIRNPNCTLCPLHEQAQYVCLMGTGSKKAKIMIVGEAPGEREDEEHAAFVGPAGQLLTQLLEEVGISRDECYITNAVKCRPMDNATPTRAQANTCQLAYGGKEVDRVEPQVILALGNTALQALTKRSGITKHRGKTFSYRGRLVFPTIHPAAALRSAHYLPMLQADFRSLARRIGKEHGVHDREMATRTSIVRNTESLKKLVTILHRAPIIAFDLETTSLHDWEPDETIVSLGVSWRPGQAAVIPLWHSSVVGKYEHEYQADLWRSNVLAVMKKILEDPDKKFIAHNGKFDCKWLAKYNIYVPLHFDTMIAAHLLDENRSKSLKQLATLLLDAEDYDVDVKGAYDMSLRKLADYNGKDCDYTLKLYHLFRKELKKDKRLARVFLRLMMPASAAFTRLEVGGTYVDPTRINKRYQEALIIVNKLERYMNKYQPKGTSINYNSPQQVGLWLFKYLKLPILERTDKNAPSTKEAVLLRLAPKHRAVRALLKYRKWSKYLSTYLRPWEAGRDTKSRIHPSYRLTGTVTGRLSSNEPNLQQVPRDPFVRGIIGAPNGWRFMEADYSQIELRIAAWMAGETRMLDVLRKGEDLHTSTAQRILGKNNISVDERVVWGKHPNFGLLYGMYPKKYREYCRDNGAIEISTEDSENVYRLFHDAYPGLRAWHKRQIRLAHRYRQVRSPMGRIRHLPDVANANDTVRMEAERQAINSPVQSFASDLMLFSAVRLAGILEHRHARLVGSVHDSLLFEVESAEVNRYRALVRQVMMDTGALRRVYGVRIDVPIEVDVSVSQHWSEDD